ncbi:MAG: lipocalin-like domain-containing protein, partial [Paramuribaculum sp.]|nr:lipocalin-like domain-containing protein [Paramuribaculum sp.]
MRYLSVILSVVALTMLSAGCTRNNGDIGPWFGTWQVTRIDVDGVPADCYRGNVVMKFQSHVMESRTQNDNHSYSAY